MLEGWIQDIEPGRKGNRLLIKVHSIAGMSASDWPVFVRVTHTSRLEVAPGRFVRCWSVLRPPPGPAMPGEYISGDRCGLSNLARSHWSESGELFIARKGGVDRVALFKGDELSPLRFSEADEMTCSDSSCIFQTLSGVSVQILYDDGRAVCLSTLRCSAPDLVPPCDAEPSGTHSSWRSTEIVSQGGGVQRSCTAENFVSPLCYLC